MMAIGNLPSFSRGRTAATRPGPRRLRGTTCGAKEKASDDAAHASASTAARTVRIVSRRSRGAVNWES
jgi:hypothetical protein